MISSSAAYKTAIVADARQILLRAIIEIISPDISYGTVSSSGEAPFSQSAQLHDETQQLVPYATLEANRWLLNGTYRIFPDSMSTGDEVGFVGDVLSGDDGSFATQPWVELAFSGVSVLQACTLTFSDDPADGYPVDFVVEIKQGGTAYHTETYTGNSKTSITIDGFTINTPDAIRVTVSKWSLPHRRLRAVEILPGLIENWDGSVLAEFDVKHQGDVSCTSLPYGTCTLRLENLDRRFEPRSKAGIFRSIEERQGIQVSLGVVLPDGSVEYKNAGVFYQYSAGWKTSDNDITIQWSLVDIIGLIANREYIPPSPLPTTLEGWIASLVAQLGVNFESAYTVDPAYASLPVTVRTADDIVGMKCGDILRYVCMATGTWPRADAETGYLAAEPLWDAGNKITLDNMSAYPTMSANNDIAAIIFTLNDGNSTQYVVSGNSTASSETLSVQNPFIQTQAQALAAARLILAAYGGNQLEITGRGDMSSEIGDVDTVWLDASSATTARRIQQNLTISDGVLQDCKSVLLQADGSFLYETREVITQNGTWTAPAGVTQIFAIVAGGGDGGESGGDGDWDEAGADGADGLGGLVWAGTININPQQQFAVSLGAGGAAGQAGGTTTFGAYSSANGERFEYGYTDVRSGESYARTGVDSPLANSADGGKGGKGGRQGRRHREDGWDMHGNPTSYWEVDSEPTGGETGVTGGSGVVVVYYDNPEV